MATPKKYKPTGHKETDYLLRSPRNAERLLRTLREAERGEGKPQTVDELRKEVGLPKDRYSWCEHYPSYLFPLSGCLHAENRADALLIPHPDDPSKKVEAFFKKPAGPAPWPMIVLLHGHQEWPRPGGKDFVTWGGSTVLRNEDSLPSPSRNPAMETHRDPPISVAH